MAAGAKSIAGQDMANASVESELRSAIVAMSEENVEIVRNAIEASMRQHWTRDAELFDPKHVLAGHP